MRSSATGTCCCSTWGISLPASCWPAATASWFQRTFSLGGGHITGDLATALEISFTKAESLKRKVVLSLNVGEQDVYEVTTRDGTESYPAQMVNEIVTETVARLARTVNKCLAQCEYDYPDYIPLSLTGGGLSYIKGARDVLSKQLGKPVEIVGPRCRSFRGRICRPVWG